MIFVAYRFDRLFCVNATDDADMTVEEVKSRVRSKFEDLFGKDEVVAVRTRQWLLNVEHRRIA